MAVTKDRIRFGDSYYLSFVANIRDRNSRNATKTPIEPVNATVELWSVTDQVYVPLGPSGTLEGAAVITDNKIEYVIDGENFVINGDYKAFVSADFDVNGETHTITATKPFRVLAKE